MNNVCTVPENLLDLPCFVISLDRRADRREEALRRVSEAGFETVTTFPAIDGRNFAQLRQAWRQFPPELFDKALPTFKTKRGTQGCYLSHVILWKKISHEEIPAAIIFEDDVVFHENWHELYPTYWAQTPKNFDIVYMGADVLDFKSKPGVICCPVLCNHATILSCGGATKLYDYITSQRPAPLDFVIYALQKRLVASDNSETLRWYNWVAQTDMDLPEINTNRHVGLVYQDRKFKSDNY